MGKQHIFVLNVSQLNIHHLFLFLGCFVSPPPPPPPPVPTMMFRNNSAVASAFLVAVFPLEVYQFCRLWHVPGSGWVHVSWVLGILILPSFCTCTTQDIMVSRNCVTCLVTVSLSALEKRLAWCFPMVFWFLHWLSNILVCFHFSHSQADCDYKSWKKCQNVWWFCCHWIYEVLLLFAYKVTSIVCQI